MWDCEHCGCMSIAASITACPMCRKESYGLLKYGPPHKAMPDGLEASFEEVAVKTLGKPKGGG